MLAGSDETPPESFTARLSYSGATCVKFVRETRGVSVLTVIIRGRTP
jgi:hypothetical protein